MRTRRQKQFFLLVGVALLTAVLFAGCQSQVVEVEVTRIVAVEEAAETMEEPAVVVTRVTVQQEAPAEALPEAAGEPEGGVEAIGTEEDGGSPFDPGSGQKVVQVRDAGRGWIDFTALPVNEEVLRVITAEAEELVVVLQKSAPGRRATLVVTPVEMIFTLERAGLPSLPAVREATPPAFWAEVDQLPAADELAELSLLLSCDLCASGGVEELLVIRRGGSMITLALDEGEAAAGLDGALTALRLRLAAGLSSEFTAAGTLRRSTETCCRLGR